MGGEGAERRSPGAGAAGQEPGVGPGPGEEEAGIRVRDPAWKGAMGRKSQKRGPRPGEGALAGCVGTVGEAREGGAG